MTTTPTTTPTTMNPIRIPDDLAPLTAAGYTVVHKDGSVYHCHDGQGRRALVEFRPSLSWTADPESQDTSEMLVAEFVSRFEAEALTPTER